MEQGSKNSRDPTETLLEMLVLPIELILLCVLVQDPLRRLDVMSVMMSVLKRNLVLLYALHNGLHLVS